MEDEPLWCEYGLPTRDIVRDTTTWMPTSRVKQ
jgi:hypothetical protein